MLGSNFAQRRSHSPKHIMLETSYNVYESQRTGKCGENLEKKGNGVKYEAISGSQKACIRQSLTGYDKKFGLIFSEREIQ